LVQKPVQITTVEISALRILEWKIIRKMCRRVKEVERWRIKINKAIKVHIKRGIYCKVYKIPPNTKV
jgi:hypothetical protein